MDPRRIGGDAGDSRFERAFHGFRRHARGPWGCLFVLLACTCSIVLLPVVIVLAIVNWARIRAVIQSQRQAERGDPHTPLGGAAAGPAPGAISDAVTARAAAMLVRAMAIDESFTREDALQAGVAAGAGKSPAELLDEAIRLGWVAARADGRLAVTPRGRDDAARLLG